MVDAEQYEIVLGDEVISYTLERKNVKNINMRMRPENGLTVSASSHIPLARIETVLRQNQKRILSVLHQYMQQEKPQQLPQCFSNGERVLYLGKYYQLEVYYGFPEGVQLQGEKLCLTAAYPTRSSYCKKIFDAWWNAACEKAICNLCRAVFPIFEAKGVLFPEIRFRTMVSQWGNCRPERGVLTFNTRLLAAPVRCIEYVVMHEFTHFLYPNHSKAFYRFVETEIPDWKVLEVQLQKTVQTRLP